VIAIDNVLVSDDVIEAQFVCDLNKCKGGCCEDGDAGAPLSVKELETLNEIYETIKPYLTPEGIRWIEKHGRYNYDREYGWVTPTINGTICAYGLRDENGIIKCGIEQAYRDGKIGFKKPISCHLYPIIVREGKNGDYDRMNYEPRDVLCKPACKLGKKLKVPVYEFLKEPLLRKYGPEFYEALEAVALKVKEDREADTAS
jgi:hypothetical protein